MSTLRYTAVSLFSDYGEKDETAGVIRSVLYSLAPGVLVIDVTHGIDAYDVRSASLALARSAPHLHPGVVICDVDSGSGRPIAVEVGGGDSVLIGPDNGVLAPVVASVGGATRAVVLEGPGNGPMGLHAGRDVYAPAAAALCVGRPLETVGSPVDTVELRPSMLPFSAEKDGLIDADVLWVDRYGAVQLNVTSEQLAHLPPSVQVKIGDKRFTAQRVTGMHELRPGSVGLMNDHHGMTALVMDKASVAERFSVSEQDSVALSAEAQP